MPIFSLGERSLTHDTDDYFIAPTATLVGSVHMGHASNIWFNCTLRADGERIVLGERCNIQDASVLHADESEPILLGRDVSIGHKVMLHGCRIGEGTLIGMNAVLLNGCSVGAGSIVAAHSRARGPAHPRRGARHGRTGQGDTHAQRRRKSPRRPNRRQLCRPRSNVSPGTQAGSPLTGHNSSKMVF